MFLAVVVVVGARRSSNKKIIAAVASSGTESDDDVADVTSFLALDVVDINEVNIYVVVAVGARRS